MSVTKIEWADETINPLVGCSRISPACDHCYAIGMAHRHGGNPKLPQYKGLTSMTPGGLDWTGEVRWVSGVPEKALLRLMNTRGNLRIFIGSMTDIGHKAATVQHLANVLAFAAALPQHTIMLLTKRPELMRERMEALRGPGFTDVWDAARKPLYEACRAEALALAKRNGNSSTPRERASLHRAEYIGMMCAEPTFPLPNVWLGTTIWDQASADRAVPILLNTPAAKRFVSVEPMLGPVDLDRFVRPIAMMQPDMAPSTWKDWNAKQLWPAWVPPKWRTLIEEFWSADFGRSPRSWLSDAIQNSAAPHGEVFHGMALDGGRVGGRFLHTWNNMCVFVDANGEAHVSSTPFHHVGESYLGLDWVICGGETGPSARPMHPDWPRSLRDDCLVADVPFFFKQWGEWAPHLPERGYDNPATDGKAWGCINREGEWKLETTPFDSDRGGYEWPMVRVGTRKAGRVLDGQEWSEAPA